MNLPNVRLNPLGVSVHFTKGTHMYMTELIKVKANVISITELIVFYIQSQKLLREYQKDALALAQREDSSGGMFS